MNARVVMAVARTTFREFWRSPEAVFWTYGFPLVMAIVLGFSFQPKAPPPVPIAVVAGAGADQLAAVLRHNERFEVQVLDAAAADRAVARGKVALLVRGGTAAPVLRADPTRPEAELARLLVERTLRDERDGPGAPLPREDENRPGARYIDFLIPGLIGLNLLGAGMWGVGFNLVQMRQGFTKYAPIGLVVAIVILLMSCAHPLLCLFLTDEDVIQIYKNKTKTQIKKEDKKEGLDEKKDGKAGKDKKKKK